MRSPASSLFSSRAASEAASLFAFGALVLWLAHPSGADVGILRHALKHVAQETFGSPFFWGAVALILTLERLFPVDRTQSSFGRGFWHDGAWLVLALGFTGTVMPAYSKALRAFYEAHFSFLTLRPAQALPESARFAVGVLVSDFLAWFQHWVKHKVPWFWEFHAVHHSQRQINLFTDYRFHYLEYLISRPIVLMPMLVLGVEAPKLAAYVLVTTWYTRLYHGNIRSDFGWLRHVLVTPQSHRVHHSIEREHHDRNFGVIFSFWDRLFGTQEKDHRAYPRTGIIDERFPVESDASWLGPLALPVRQTLYPFASIARGLRRR